MHNSKKRSTRAQCITNQPFKAFVKGTQDTPEYGACSAQAESRSRGNEALMSCPALLAQPEPPHADYYFWKGGATEPIPKKQVLVSSQALFAQIIRHCLSTTNTCAHGSVAPFHTKPLSDALSAVCQGAVPASAKARRIAAALSTTLWAE